MRKAKQAIEIPRKYEIIINIILLMIIIGYLIFSPFFNPINNFVKIFVKNKWIYNSITMGNRGERESDAQTENQITRLNKSIVLSPDYVIYGPYQTLMKGKYRIIFRLKTDKKIKGKILKLDISKNQGAVRVKERMITGADFDKINQYQDFSVDIDAETGRNFEYRIFYYQGNIWVDTISVEVIDRDWAGFCDTFPEKFKKFIKKE